MAHDLSTAIKQLYGRLRPKEESMLWWAATGTAAAGWFSIAWRDPWVLLLVPMIAAWFVFLVHRNRRLDPLGEDVADDDPDWF